MTSTVYIAKNVYGGDGLGRLGDGRVIFVPGAWAGESVKAEITAEKRHFVKSRLIEVVERSAERIDDDALVTIPGCVYAGLSFAGERSAKEQQLKDFFERARLSVKNFKGECGEAEMLNYRNKVVYHFAKYPEGWRIGYHREPSHELVDIVSDPLAVKPINAALAEIRRAIIALLTTGPIAVRRETERKGCVTIRWTARTGVKWWIGDAPADVILKEDTCGQIFEVPADGFYQVNPQVGEELVKAVANEYEAIRASAGRILDLYCGVGVFGLICRPERLIGIESGRRAIEFAKRNAASQNYVAAKFFAEQVGSNLRRIPIGRESVVIVDPPRGGMEPNVPMWLAKSGAPYIFYVSCDPATLMRDLVKLNTAYDVESVRWFNMFPRTARFETLVILKKRGL